MDVCLHFFSCIFILYKSVKIGKYEGKMFLLIFFWITEIKISPVGLKMWFPHQQQQPGSSPGRFRHANSQAPPTTSETEIGYVAQQSVFYNNKPSKYS